MAMAIDYFCDAALGLYGSCPWPHRGRDRVVTLLEKRAQRRWNGVRSITRRGMRFETDLTVDDVGWILYAYGCLDYYDERAIHGMIQPGSVCFDVGAHIGYYSLLLSRWTGPGGRVFSFEPTPYTHSFLTRNLRRNEASNVTVVQAAVGSEIRKVRMSGLKGERLGGRSVTDTGDTEVRCTTIDSEIERINPDRLDFIKMDVEGYELQVLSGAQRALERFRPKIMLEVNPTALQQHDSDPPMLQDFLRSRNYGLSRAGADGLAAISDISDGPGTYFNVFALPHADRGTTTTGQNTR